MILLERLRRILVHEGFPEQAGRVAVETQRLRQQIHHFRPLRRWKFFVIPIREPGLPRGGYDVQDPDEMVDRIRENLLLMKQINERRGNPSIGTKNVDEILYQVDKPLKSRGSEYAANHRQQKPEPKPTPTPDVMTTPPRSEQDDVLEARKPNQPDDEAGAVKNPDVPKDQVPRVKPKIAVKDHDAESRPNLDSRLDSASNTSGPSTSTKTDTRGTSEPVLTPPSILTPEFRAPILIPTGHEFEGEVTRRLNLQRDAARGNHASDWIDTLCLDDLEPLPVAGSGPRLTRGNGPTRGELIRTFHLDHQPRRLYLIGDIHGDLLALESCIECIRRDDLRDQIPATQSGPSGDRPNGPTVVLLGDLIDDGPESLLVLRRVLEWAGETRLILIPGNHDLALKKNAGNDPAYRAEVSPCEFTDELNDPESSFTREDQDLVDHFIQYCEEAPAALILPDNSLAVHGGVPHVDLHEDLLAWFRADAGARPELSGTIAERVREDFAWGRIHPKAKRKIADRSVRGQEMGVEDVAKSLDVLGELLGGRRPIRIIRGHDHLENRWDIPKKHEGRVITINAMSYRQGREHLGPPTRKPIVARWDTRGPGQEGDITLLQIDLAEAFVEEHALELQERRRQREQESQAEPPRESRPQSESSGDVDS